MSTVTVDLRLRSVEDFFRKPGVDPFSDWYQPYSDQPAIEYVEACVGDHTGTERVEINVIVPPEAYDERTEERLRGAVRKYCEAHLVTIERDSQRNNSRGWLMLAFSVFVVAFFVWMAHRFSDADFEPLTIAAEGLSIAAWVLLWHPLEALVFNRWDYRLDLRILRTIRDRSVISVRTGEATPGD